MLGLDHSKTESPADLIHPLLIQRLLREGYVKLPSCTGGLSNITMPLTLQFMPVWSLYSHVVSTFSESRSTLSEILLSDTRTSVFCCRVSIIIIGMLVSDELAAATKWHHCATTQRLLITHASQAPPASLITASPSHCTYVDMHITQTPTGCVVVWNNSRLGQQHCASAWQKHHNNVSHG